MAKKTAKKIIKTPIKKAPPTKQSKPIAKAKSITVKSNKVKSNTVKVVSKNSVKKTVKVVNKKVATKKIVKVNKVKTPTTIHTSGKNIKDKTKAIVANSSPLKIENIVVKKSKPVVLPTIKTKKSISYEPAYVNSVLDTKPNTHKNQVKYSDTDLRMFKEIILKKLEASKSELSYLQNIISKSGDVGFHDSDNKSFSIEEGGVGLEKEQLTQMARRQIQFIDNLEKALIRIENKTYGVCIVSGQLIDKDRLKAVPHARLSLEAKMENMNNKN